MTDSSSPRLLRTVALASLSALLVFGACEVSGPAITTPQPQNPMEVMAAEDESPTSPIGVRDLRVSAPEGNVGVVAAVGTTVNLDTGEPLGGVQVAVGGTGTGVAGWGVGVDVAVAAGTGVHVAVGSAGIGVGVQVGVHVAVGSGVAVGSRFSMKRGTRASYSLPNVSRTTNRRLWGPFPSPRVSHWPRMPPGWGWPMGPMIGTLNAPGL